jgi:hypothetical protein
MRNETPPTEASQHYAAAYAAHYTTKDLREALELYKSILAAHPDTQEAGFSRSQILNIAHLVVPKKELFDALVNLALAHSKHGDQPDGRRARVTPLVPELAT